MSEQKKIPWWMPEIGPEEYIYVKKVLDANYTNQGPLTAEFEEKLAQYVGVKHALLTTSGTIAIFMALKAHDIGPGDEVIVPDITYIATANAVSLTGARVVLIDTDDKLMISIEAAKKAITGKTKAIIPVHVSGRQGNIEEVIQLAEENNLIVVEDAAEALGSKHQGKYLGTFGQAGCYSLSPNKIITSGQGGVVVTNDEKLYTRLRELRNQGVAGKLTGGDDIHPTLGFNFKFTDLQAALALGQFSYLEKRLERMKKTHEMYTQKLSNIPGFKIFECNTEAGEVPLWTDAVLEKRNELDTYLRTENIDCRRFWFPLHTQNPYKSDEQNFPVSAKNGPKAIWLPSAFTMTDQDVETVSEKIRSFFSAH